jgi:hypothetical protein
VDAIAETSYRVIILSYPPPRLRDTPLRPHLQYYYAFATRYYGRLMRSAIDALRWTISSNLELSNCRHTSICQYEQIMSSGHDLLGPGYERSYSLNTRDRYPLG